MVTVWLLRQQEKRWGCWRARCWLRARDSFPSERGSAPTRRSGPDRAEPTALIPVHFCLRSLHTQEHEYVWHAVWGGGCSAAAQQGPPGAAAADQQPAAGRGRQMARCECGRQGRAAGGCQPCGLGALWSRKSGGVGRPGFESHAEEGDFKQGHSKCGINRRLK